MDHRFSGHIRLGAG